MQRIHDPQERGFASDNYSGVHPEVLAALADDWLAPGAIVVVERSARSPEPTWPPGLERFRHKEHGETALWFAEPVDPRA